jgi:hypothetical protein
MRKTSWKYHSGNKILPFVGYISSNASDLKPKFRWWPHSSDMRPFGAAPCSAKCVHHTTLHYITWHHITLHYVIWRCIIWHNYDITLYIYDMALHDIAFKLKLFWNSNSCLHAHIICTTLSSKTPRGCFKEVGFKRGEVKEKLTLRKASCFLLKKGTFRKI